jgi:voltage-gated potassium channel
LVKQSGADSVIISSGAAGRLLGLAARQPGTVSVLEDLLLVGRGIDLAERVITAEDAGPRTELVEERPMLGVLRGERLLSFDDPETDELRTGDRLVVAVNRDREPADGAAGSSEGVAG